MSIESVRQRLDAATPGPWAGSPGRIYGAVVRPGLSNGNAATDAAYGCRVVGESMGNADADLIAHAPTDLALLVAVAKAAKDVRDGTGVEYADERLRYAVLQIDREDWGRLMAALDALEAAQ